MKKLSVRSVTDRVFFLFFDLVLLLWDNGKVGERFGWTGVDEAVGMAFGTIMALPRGEKFLTIVVEAAGFAAEDINHLAGGVVAVIADGASRFKTA